MIILRQDQRLAERGIFYVGDGDSGDGDGDGDSIQPDTDPRFSQFPDGNGWSGFPTARTSFEQIVFNAALTLTWRRK